MDGTTGEVIPFKRKDDPTAVELQGAVHCMECGHEWHGIAPVGVVWLECPKCTLFRGTWKYPVVRGEYEWECKCGYRLFRMNEKGAHCVRCGNYRTEY